MYTHVVCVYVVCRGVCVYIVCGGVCVCVYVVYGGVCVCVRCARRCVCVRCVCCRYRVCMLCGAGMEAAFSDWYSHHTSGGKDSQVKIVQFFFFLFIYYYYFFFGGGQKPKVYNSKYVWVCACVCGCVHVCVGVCMCICMLLTWLSLRAHKADYWTRSSPILVETIVMMLPIIAVDGSIPRIIPEHVWSTTDSHCSQDCKGFKADTR